MDFAKARFNMVEQQIRPWDVLDFDLLDALQDLPRELFVSEEQKHTLIPIPRCRCPTAAPCLSRKSWRVWYKVWPCKNRQRFGNWYRFRLCNGSVG